MGGGFHIGLGGEREKYNLDGCIYWVYGGVKSFHVLEHVRLGGHGDFSGGES